VKLIIQPDNGINPLLRAVKTAKRTIVIVIFRFDRVDLEKALEAAVARGVTVRALIAHTNSGGEKILRKLEARLLASGVIVARTADDLPRYHGKMIIVDSVLYVLGFNFTKLDIDKSRSLGVITPDPRLVKEATALFEADTTRQPYAPMHDRLVVSPETSRAKLTAFIKGAKKQLLIYDAQVTDNLILRLLEARAKAGIEIRIIGKIEKPIAGIEVRKLTDMRLHVRAMVRDGSSAFIGSQSLRKIELDRRREVGVLISNARVARKIQSVFETDWQHAAVKSAAPAEAKDERAAGKGDTEKVEKKAS
jgi:cardiolipin synthase